MRHPEFLKIGAHVEYRHPSGVMVQGRVDGNDVKTNGVWVAVNIAPKGKNRVLKHFRPTQLRAVK